MFYSGHSYINVDRKYLTFGETKTSTPSKYLDIVDEITPLEIYAYSCDHTLQPRMPLKGHFNIWLSKMTSKMSNCPIFAFLVAKGFVFAPVFAHFVVVVVVSDPLRSCGLVVEGDCIEFLRR